MLKITEYLLKERFDTKYLYQVSYLLDAYQVWCWCFARCSWCVLIILLSIWHNMCACHSPVYHYITATAVYLMQRFITVCVVVT